MHFDPLVGAAPPPKMGFRPRSDDEIVVGEAWVAKARPSSFSEV